MCSEAVCSRQMPLLTIVEIGMRQAGEWNIRLRMVGVNSNLKVERSSLFRRTWKAKTRGGSGLTSF